MKFPLWRIGWVCSHAFLWYVCGNRLPHSFLASPLVYAIGEGSRIGYGMRFQAPLWLSVGYGLSGMVGTRLFVLFNASAA